MKRASAVKEQIYRQLYRDLKERVDTLTYSQAKTDKWIEAFCRYLANYSEVKEIEEITETSIQDYFTFVMANYKRLNIDLTDIKHSIRLFGQTLNIPVEEQLNNFSLENIGLWKNLK